MTIADYTQHLPPLVPPDEVQPVSRLFLQECPVAHSDQDGGFWILNRHVDVCAVMQDWERFRSGSKGVRVPHQPVVMPEMPPLDSNPPLHRKVREVLNPFLSPAAMAIHEPTFRSIIGGLIDKFAPTGRCDIASELAKRFPSQIASEVFFGVTDPDEVDRLRVWVRRLSYDMMRDDPAELRKVHDDWLRWCYDLVDARRRSPCGDIVSTLLKSPVDEAGNPLSDEEIVGSIQILTLGGFSTTSDATSNIVIRLIEEPGLEELLREHPKRIPAAIEEILRLEPPVTARPRLATEDVEIGGQTIRKGERVLCNYLAANVDPAEWEDPESFILDRVRNRVTTFGVGRHRCIGSNLARTSLRIMTEELLARVRDLDWADEAHEVRVSFNPSTWRAVDSLPVVFTPVG